MFNTLKAIFSRSEMLWELCLFLLCLMLPVSAAGQVTVTTYTPNWALKWPQTPQQVATDNRMPPSKMSALLHSPVTGPAVPMKVYGFRFAYLEPGRLYLVTAIGTRIAWLGTMTPIGGGRFVSTSLDGVSNGTVANSLVDLRGNGVDEVISLRLVDNHGSATAPIYWYTIYQFHDGKPVDVSAQFPEYYRDVVLPPLAYLENVFYWMKTNVPAKVLREHPGQLGPGTPDVELAEIGFVRLKYQHVILGHKNAGLQRALRWAQSSNSDIAVLGVRSLAEMTAPRAWEEIHKLWNSPDYEVCMEARPAWLKHVGKPFTAKEVCPLPGPRRH